MENMENEPIVGPRAHEREPKVTPYEVRLSDESPLYYVFLEDPNALSLTPWEVQSAKGRLYQIIEENPELVLSCQGKSLEEARAILEQGGEVKSA